MSRVDLALAYHDQYDRLDEATALLQQALTTFRELGDRPSEGQTLTYLGSVHARAGHPDAAIDSLQQSLAILRGLGNRSAEAEALMSMGGVYHDRRQFDEAIDCFEQSMTIYRQQGDHRREAVVSIEVGKTLRRVGNKAAARARYEEALAVFTELGVPEADNVRALLGSLDAFPKMMVPAQAMRAEQGEEPIVLRPDRLPSRLGEPAPAILVGPAKIPWSQGRDLPAVAASLSAE